MLAQALHFHKCENLIVRKLSHMNSPRNHISMNMCNGSLISNLQIIAPKDSPNTDGIDISASSNIFIHHSTIQTGDDCIAINTASSFINITAVFCGPGHGISTTLGYIYIYVCLVNPSIGSLGKNGEYATVEEIYVRNCTFKETTNGARIKTWTGGAGYARKIRFEDIVVVNSGNPLIINQHYSSGVKKNDNGDAVKISDVTYRNVKGTTSSENAITLKCDPSVACTDIVLDDISITTENGSITKGLCTNAQGTCSSCHPLVPCLSHNSNDHFIPR
ncbi:putative polygalacturonase, partial [Mucuna pruriens]